MALPGGKQGDESYPSEPENPRYHHYYIKGQICEESDQKCSLDNIIGILDQHGNHRIPGAPDRPLKNEEVVSVPLLGPVTATIDKQNYTATNTTKPEHLLDPGKVEIRCRVEGKAVVLEIEGTGTGPLPRINELAAGTLWGPKIQQCKETYEKEKRTLPDRQGPLRPPPNLSAPGPRYPDARQNPQEVQATKNLLDLLNNAI